MNISRTLQLSTTSNKGSAVVYVMSRDQRVYDNHALLAAQAEAIAHKAPLVVLFNLHTNTCVRAREHYDFMLSGLEEVAATLQSLNISWVMSSGDTTTSTLALLKATNAASVYFDFSPLVGPRALTKKIATEFSGSTYVVDTHNTIPVWQVSEKQEYAAHTIRTKIHKLLPDYLAEPNSIVYHPYTIDEKIDSISFESARDILETIPSSGTTFTCKPGEAAAQKHLKNFLHSELDQYAMLRNDITHDHQSGLSPYLHFGQISSLRVALETLKTVQRIPLLFEQARLAQTLGEPSAYEGMNALFEEMIVRKELADNFCFYASSYKSFSSMPAWAQKTLDGHRNDPRDFIYTTEQWESAQTHDEPWNAAQNQLRQTGKIHGYMRMYWAKKILEWSASPEEALQTCIYLNDHYSIDGGDPNGYVGILWSLAGLHDRPWFERAVFGKVRYMNAGGLKRKFDIASYIIQWTPEIKTEVPTSTVV